MNARIANFKNEDGLAVRALDPALSAGPAEGPGLPRHGSN